MKIITASHNLTGGVSQQAKAIRLPSQVDDMVNYYVHPITGLTKRHPTKWVARLLAGTMADAQIHTINRDGAEKYVVVVTAAGISVYDESGAAMTVNSSASGTAYLVGATPSTDIRMVTIADTTFVLNTARTPAMSGSTSAAKSSTGLFYLWIRQGNYKSKYYVDLKQGATVSNISCETWDGGGTPGTTSIGPLPGALGTGQIDSINTDDIAEDLRIQINALAGITATRVGSLIEVTSATAFDDVTISDTAGDVMMVRMNNTIDRASDLPTVCRGGTVIRVAGDFESGQDDYFVKFVADDGGTTFGSGYWEESLDYSTPYAIDPANLPHILVRTSAGVFDFDPAPWADRLVGDTELNPDPSFIGNTIRDVFFTRNRLGFATDIGEVLSAAGDYYNFFRTTITDLVDNDPIDFQISHGKVSLIHSVLPWGSGHVPFSKSTVFLTNGNPTLTSKTVSADPIVESESIETVRPVNAGRTILFGFTHEGYSGVRELYPLGDGVSYDAADITKHCPQYIDGTITHMSVSTMEDMVAILTDEGDNSIWIYKYLWDGSQKIQSAWFKYTFTRTILAAQWLDSSLFLVVQRDDGVHLERMDVAPNLIDEDEGYLVCLDRRVDETQCAINGYNPVQDITEIVLPYEIDPGATVETWTRADGSHPGGLNITTQQQSGTILWLSGDRTTSKFYVGEKYTASVVIKNPVLQERTDTGKGVVGSGRHQILHGVIVMDKSTYFNVAVTLPKRTIPDKTYDTFVPTAASPDILELRDDRFRFPVRGRSDETTVTITNDTPLPSNLIHLEWQARYDSQHRRA